MVFRPPEAEIIRTQEAFLACVIALESIFSEREALARSLSNRLAVVAAGPLAQRSRQLRHRREISGVTGSASFPVTPEFPVSSLETKLVNWEGELRRDQWNLFSLKVLTRLAQAKSVKINVKVDAEIEDTQTLDQLNTGLRELGLTNLFSQT
jgi:hypothetical protein